MKVKHVLIALLWVVASAATLNAKIRCVIVGISDYQNPNIPDIRGPLGDIRKFVDLAHYMGFSDDEIIVLKNSEATRERILYWLRKIAEEATPGDAIAVLYSGHGTQVPDDNGDEPDEYDEAIVPYDASKLEDVIRDDQINRIFSSSKAGKRIYIFDSCHSGTGIKDIGAAGSIKYVPPSVFDGFTQMPPPGSQSYKNINVEADNNLESGSKDVIFMSASAANEVAFGDIGGLNASTFTYALYRGVIQNKADYNYDGKVTFSEARTYAVSYLTDTLGLNQSPQLEVNPERAENYVIKGLVLVTNVAHSGTPTYSNDPIVQVLEETFKKSNLHIDISSPKNTYYIGDFLNFTVDVPVTGYIYVIAAEPDGSAHLLFPNDFNSQNYFTGGAQIRIPDDIGGFRLRASEPEGKSIVYVFLTRKYVSIFEWLRRMSTNQGKAIPEIPKNSKALKGLRAIMVVPTNGDFGAGRITVTIKKR